MLSYKTLATTVEPSPARHPLGIRDQLGHLPQRRWVQFFLISGLFSALTYTQGLIDFSEHRSLTQLASDYQENLENFGTQYWHWPMLQINWMLFCLSHLINAGRNALTDLSVYGSVPRAARERFPLPVPLVNIEKMIESVNQGALAIVASVSGKALADEVVHLTDMETGTAVVATFVITCVIDGAYSLSMRKWRDPKAKGAMLRREFWNPIAANLILSPFRAHLTPVVWYLLGKTLRNFFYFLNELHTQRTAILKNEPEHYLTR